MEVRPGYKRTEVGVIPEDWEVAELQKLASSAPHAIVGGPFGSDLTAADYTEDGVPVIRGQNLGSKWLAGPFAFVSTGKADLLRANRAVPGDLVFTQRGSLGQVSLVPPEPYDAYVVSQSQMKVSLHRESATARFYYHVFSADRHQHLIRTSAIQTGIPHINLGILRQLPVPELPLDEQLAIANALDDIDTLLASLDRLLAKKRDLKQAAMQQLLTGEVRLPGFSGEWNEERLGDVAEVRTGPFGSVLHESDYVQDGTPIITVEHLGEFGVEHRDLPRVSDVDRSRLQAYSLEAGDIVFSRVGSVDRNALIRPSEVGWLFSGRLLRVSAQAATVDGLFLSYQFHSEPSKAMIRTVAVGQTMACLNTRLLSDLPVTLPPLPEQHAIATVLSDMDADIEALEGRREKTLGLKQAMMQELLTGKTRLL